MLFRSICLTTIAFIVLSCSGNDSTSPSPVGNNRSPADHTVSQGGRFHAPGLANPQVNCASCHGQNLRGGTNGEPSCYMCHGEVWSN
jgi:hypothetical protein